MANGTGAAECAPPLYGGRMVRQHQDAPTLVPLEGLQHRADDVLVHLLDRLGLHRQVAFVAGLVRRLDVDEHQIVLVRGP